MLRQLAASAVAIAATAACGTATSNLAAPPSAGNGSADTECAAKAAPLAASVAPEATAVRAVRTTVRKLVSWQSTRFVAGEGPDLKDAGLAAEDPAATVYVCIYDGAFGTLRGGPDSTSASASNRMVILVDVDGAARIELTTTQAKLSSLGPPPEGQAY